jgi:hypothetical protein
VSLGVIAVDALVVLGVVLQVWWSRKVWRNEAPASHPDIPSVGWPWWRSDRAWRGWVRMQTFVVPLIVIPLALLFVVDSTGASGLAAGLIDALALLAMIVGAAAAPLVVLFNRPKRLVAPHLRRQPGLIAELLGERPADVPAPRGSDERLAREPGLFTFVVVALTFGFGVAWACTVALVPALVAAVVSGAVTTLVIRAVRASGRLPDRWVDRFESWPKFGSWKWNLQVTAALAFAGGLIFVWERSTSDSVAAAAMGVLMGSCFAAATDGMRLALDHRRRLRAQPDETVRVPPRTPA